MSELRNGVPQPRVEYRRGELRRDDVPADDPLEAVCRWLVEADAAGLQEATSAVLATVDADGVPDARVVLVRGIDDRGASWYSNRGSVKGQQLSLRPAAALVWYWPQLERQVRMRGRVEWVSDAESDDYWSSRPRASQLAAAVSHQSAPVAGREQLEARFRELAERYPDDTPIPRPPPWGGARLVPDAVELWQGRPARLHDRLRWTRTAEGWRLERLMP